MECDVINFAHLQKSQAQEPMLTGSMNRQNSINKPGYIINLLGYVQQSTMLTILAQK